MAANLVAAARALILHPLAPTQDIDEGASAHAPGA